MKEEIQKNVDLIKKRLEKAGGLSLVLWEGHCGKCIFAGCVKESGEFGLVTDGEIPDIYQNLIIKINDEINKFNSNETSTL